VDGSGFEKIAPYLQDPLVLVGFAALLFFGLARTLFKSGLLTPVAGAKSYRLLQTVMLYGFVMGIAIIGLGFGLKYRELSQSEQRSAVSLITREFEANLAAVEALRKNTISMLEIVQQTANSLRDPAIPALAVLFPAANVSGGNEKAPKELALDALSALFDRKLDRNKLEMSRGDSAARAIKETIDRTRPVVVSLSDPLRQRYVIREDAWNANLPILRKVSLGGVPELQDSYAATRRLRADYDVVCAAVIAYLDSLETIFDKKKGVNLESLTSVLAQERLSVQLLSAYGDSLMSQLVKLKAVQDGLQPKLRHTGD